MRLIRKKGKVSSRLFTYIAVLGMQTRRCHMERTFRWIVVLQVLVQRKQINVMHGDVVKIVFCKQISHIDQWSSIESEPISLIDNENVVRNLLIVEKPVHVRNKLKKFFKSIAKRNNQSQFLHRAWADNTVKVFLIGDIAVNWFVTFNIVLAVAGI